jgi:type IV pilus assembly protein PilW
MTAFSPPPPRRAGTKPPETGRTLIELLIALIIGAIILGGVLLSSISSSRTQNQQNSSSFLSEEAQIASNLLTWHLRVAGYSTLVLPPKPQTFNEPRNVYRNYDEPAVRGCDGGVANPSVTMSAMNCINGNGADALLVAYEGNTRNTLPTATNPNSPTDCLGQAVTTQVPSAAGTGMNYTLVENMFYVNGNTLMCAGNGTAARTPQPLVDNVMDMQISYGVAGVPAAAANSTVPAEPYFEPTQYLTASQVNALAAFPAGTNPAYLGQWNRVVSLRICLTLRTANPVYESPKDYVGCDGQAITPADNRAYRVVTVYSALKNRTPPCSDPNAAPTGVTPAFDRCAF